MSDSNEEELNRLLEFLYIAPVGLLDFDITGTIHLANPRITQIFNPFCPSGQVSNIFDILNPQLPEMVQRIVNFEKSSGTVIDNECITLMAPTSMDDSTPQRELILDLTVLKQPVDRFYASVNNVTENAMLARENMLYDQTLNSVARCVDSYVIFTTDPKGIVASWNDNAERLTGIPYSQAIGTQYSDLVGRSRQDGDSLLKQSRSCGSIAFKGDHQGFKDSMLNVLKNPSGDILGYSAICRHTGGA